MTSAHSVAMGEDSQPTSTWQILVDNLNVLEFSVFLGKFTRSHSIASPAYDRDDLFDKVDHNLFFCIMYFALEKLEGQKATAQFKGLIPCRDHSMMDKMSKTTFKITQDLLNSLADMKLFVARPVLAHFITPKGEKLRCFLISLTNYLIYSHKKRAPRECDSITAESLNDVSLQVENVMSNYRQIESTKNECIHSWESHHNPLKKMLSTSNDSLEAMKSRIINCEDMVSTDSSTTTLLERANATWARARNLHEMATMNVVNLKSIIPVVESSSKRGNSSISGVSTDVRTDLLLRNLAAQIQIMREELSHMSVKHLYELARRFTDNARTLSSYLQEHNMVLEKLSTTKATKEMKVFDYRKVLITYPETRGRIKMFSSLLADTCISPTDSSLSLRPSKRPKNVKRESLETLKAFLEKHSPQTFSRPNNRSMMDSSRRRFSVLDNSFQFADVSLAGFSPVAIGDDSLIEQFTPPSRSGINDSGKQNVSIQSSKVNTGRRLKNRFSMPASAQVLHGESPTILKNLISQNK